MNEDTFEGLSYKGLKPTFLPPLLPGSATCWYPAQEAHRASAASCSNSRLSSGRQGPVQLLTAFGGTTVIFDLLFLVQEKSFLWCLGPETSCLPEWVETQNRLHKNSGNFQIILISGTTWLANVWSYQKKKNANSFWMKNDWRGKYKNVFIS